MDGWYEILDGRDVAEDAPSRALRARQLASAIRTNKDWELLRWYHLESDPPCEVLAVEVECHGVPPENPAGIRFRERLAMLVSADDHRLVEVIALRRDFPRLMHQSARSAEEPPLLCLYTADARSVARTWTAPGFLRRIQYWLEKSARGDLHLADQPVEAMFLTTKYELVLPWNFDDQQRIGSTQFRIEAGPERDRGHRTFTLRELQPGQADPMHSALLFLRIPPATHGAIETSPATLGELADLMRERAGAEVLPGLVEQLKARVPAGTGAAKAGDSKFTILVVEIPIRRSDGALTEGVQRRGYFVAEGAFKLGKRIGALVEHEGKYFQDSPLPGIAPATEWRECLIEAVDILRGLTPEIARSQAGIEDAGPAGVVVGAGALGGALLELWIRSGWGQWTVIDQDYVKPHNLVRSPYEKPDLGWPKAFALARRHQAILDGAGKIEALPKDACDFEDEQVLSALRAARLVVDVSAALDFPRLASTRDELGRHCSIFMTPSGSSGVMLMEDANRSVKLRTLEAQYYRAVLGEAWGSDHLVGNRGMFWSGTGCRDISMVLPYSAVMSFAALFSEQVRSAAVSSAAAATVWTRDAVTGAVGAYAISPHGERRLPFGELTAYIDEGLVSKLMALRQQSLPRETGGILLGYYDFNVNSLCIVDALPAPPDSVATGGSFERGVAGVAEAVEEARRRTAGVVSYVGEWHSHPPGHSADPSQDDIYQLIYLALGMGDDGLPAVSLIVGEGGDLQALGASVRT